MKSRMTVAGAALGLLLGSAFAAPTALEAQGPDGRWPLQPTSRNNRVIAPFMEGWYANEDGTYSISFGYLNMNGEVLEIPLGEDNFLEPAQFDGMQPTYFESGHPRGLFTVTLPASMRDLSVWWNIRNPNGELTRVPGRTTATAYELDWTPRPHGSLPPRVTFDGQSEAGRGPPGIMAERVVSARVGQQIVLAVTGEDLSQRDQSERRFQNIAIRATWAKHQGPVGGEVEFTRHESNPVPPPAEGRGGRGGAAPDSVGGNAPAGGGGGGGRGRGGRGGGPPAPEVISLAEGRGTAQVYATFSAPGEYVMRVQVDNFSAPDSSSGNQCCWTNGYVRVNVTP